MKIFRSIIAGLVLLTTASFAATPTKYIIVLNFTNKVLQVDGSSTASSIPVQQWDMTGAPNQQWTLQFAGTSMYYIVNVATGKALNMQSVTRGAAADVRAFSRSSYRQQWFVKNDSYGVVELYNANSRLGLGISADADHWANGAAINQWDKQTTNLGWTWMLVPVSNSLPTGGPVTTLSSVVQYAYEVDVANVKNAVRVSYKTWTEASGPDNAVWTDGWFDTFRGVWYGTIYEQNDEEGVYTTQAWGQATDGTWHLIGDTSVMMISASQPLPPSRPAVGY